MLIPTFYLKFVCVSYTQLNFQIRKQMVRELTVTPQAINYEIFNKTNVLM